ncbi:hypothetical protein BDW67DRAFT_161097 [Aspergillus spinulosporus]
MSSLAQSTSSTFPLGQPVAAAPPDEEVLSLDLEEEDYLYRIRRNKRIVYVSILSGDILPHDCRTDSSRILSQLRNIPMWEGEWKTITIQRNSHGLESTPDKFLPHGLDLRQLDSNSGSIYNLLDLATVSRISDRISRVRCDGKTWILKVARFRHELPALQREVSVYSTLASSGFQLAPRFIGFIYEETKDRTVGFLMEEILGSHPDIQNLDECRETARRLHASGIIHGDLNRYNFLMTDSGAKVFDFEVSVAEGDADPAAAEEEMKTLESKLKDESGIEKR